jgi:hypothetical protein
MTVEVVSEANSRIASDERGCIGGKRGGLIRRRGVGHDEANTETAMRLWFPELAQHGVYRVESCINLFSDLSHERGRCQRMGSNRVH